MLRQTVLFSLPLTLIIANACTDQDNALLKIEGLPKQTITYENPLASHDWPDPGVTVVKDEATGDLVFYLAHTGGSMPIKKSRDLVNWEDTGASIMPEGKPDWALNRHRNWAPEIHKVGDKYIAYYTAAASLEVGPDSVRPSHDTSLAIGAAWADNILGPYTHLQAPLVPPGPDGTIDATYFYDNGRHYLYWKTDGNCCRRQTHIMVRELKDNGLEFVEGSVSKSVLADTLNWEGGLVEAPWLIRRGEYIYLFYSADKWNVDYKTGVARSKSPTGEFEKLTSSFLKGDRGSGVEVEGPGHGSVLNINGTYLYLHHGYLARSRQDDNQRYIFLTPISWNDQDWPYVEGGVTPIGPITINLNLKAED